MKRNLVVLALLAAIALLSAAPTLANFGGRTVIKEYSGPGTVDWTWPTGGGGGTAQLNGIKVMPRAGETRLEATVTDAFQTKMGAYIRQGASETHAQVFHGFCESTADAVKIDPSRAVWIYVSTTPCGQTPGTPVSGEVTLTFIKP